MFGDTNSIRYIFYKEYAYIHTKMFFNILVYTNFKSFFYLCFYNFKIREL